MRRILAVLEHLQPVAREVERERNDLGPELVVGIEDREIRHLVGRTHPREDDAGVLVGGIGRMAKPFFDRAVGIVGCFENGAVRGEMPTVIAAAQTLVGRQAVFERGAAMAALLLDQANGTGARSEQDEVLAEHPHAQRHVAELFVEAHRLPQCALDTRRRVFPLRYG